MDVCFRANFVRSYPKSGHSEAHAGLPLLTQLGHSGDEVYGRQAYRNSVIAAHLAIERKIGGTRKTAAGPRHERRVGLPIRDATTYFSPMTGDFKQKLRFIYRY